MTGADAPLPADWRRIALAPPRALGAPRVRGRLKASAGDFRVEERLGFAPDGGSGHLLLKVEKTDANTLYIARLLARAAGQRPQDVGLAGLKDRRAVATQWFSLPAGRAARDWAGFEGPGFRVIEAHPHSRKLRRGALAGNRFHVVLRDLEGDVDDLGRRLERVAAAGVPNYFGPQRFGRDGANLEAVARWLAGERLPAHREARAFVLSAARALAFNAVLAERVAAGSWESLLPGEVVNLDGSASVFFAADIDAELAGRCASFDVHPTGPLPGQEGLRPGAAAGAIEEAALAPFGPLVAALEEAGAEASRRPLRVRPAELESLPGPGQTALAFDLPRGAFATAVLAELVDCDGPEEGDADSG